MVRLLFGIPRRISVNVFSLLFGIPRDIHWDPLSAYDPQVRVSGDVLSALVEMGLLEPLFDLHALDGVHVATQV